MNNHLVHIDNFAFGERLKSLRNDSGMAQNDMAKMIGVEKSTLSLYESGKVIPSLDKTYTIAELLGVSIDYLVGREEVGNRSISSTADMARLLMRLCEFEGVSLSNSSEGPVLHIDSSELREFLSNQINLELALKESNVNTEEQQKLLRNTLRLNLMGLEGIAAKRKTGDTSVNEPSNNVTGEYFSKGVAILPKVSDFSITKSTRKRRSAAANGTSGTNKADIDIDK